MDKKLRFIQVTCCIGIVVDLLWAIGLFYPSVFILLTGKSQMVFTYQMRLIMAVAGSLMLGWTFLLFWTVQKPLERRMVLLITAFPVIFGMFVLSSLSVINGSAYGLWIAVKTLMLGVMMISAFRFAGELEKNTM